MAHPQPASWPPGLVPVVNQVVAAHRPLPPRWDCAACGQAWPCRTERSRLQRRFAGRPDRLGRHLWQEMVAAAQYVSRSDELYLRFLAWTLEGVLTPSLDFQTRMSPPTHRISGLECAGPVPPKS